MIVCASSTGSILPARMNSEKHAASKALKDGVKKGE